MPKQIKVGGHIFAVKHPHQMKEASNLRGQCDTQNLEIRISGKTQSGSDLPESHAKECLLHEIIHAVDVVYMNDKLDEDQVSALAQGLFQVLQDNDLSCLSRS